MLNIIKKDTSRKSNSVYYICECLLCSSIKSIRADALRRWQNSCGCYTSRIDISWYIYWKITILSYSHTEHRKPYWHALCDCWNKFIVKWEAVKSWNTKTCWCNRSKFASVNHRMYVIYWWMKQRCNYKNQISYHIYWWRWIKVEWWSYDDFFKDMYESYIQHVDQHWEKNTTIDRIDVNGNYCKENCRWATNKMQWMNTRRKRFVSFQWKTYRLSELAEKLWVKSSQIVYRISKWINLDEFFLWNPVIIRCKKWVVQKTLSWDLVNKFESIQEAYRKTLIPSPNISECCNWNRKSAWWYIWEFVTHIPWDQS